MRVEIYGDIYDSEKCPLPRASHVLASWFTRNDIVQEAEELRPAFIQHYLRHGIEIKYRGNPDKIFQTYLLARVVWFKSHHKRKFYKEPLEVWCRSEFEESGPATFLTVARINCRFCQSREMSPFLDNRGRKYL